ncbi:MAG: alkaline phosphatase, partial [Gammaproteobacteria bacterium]|nr:alkaline phosphatase [Gammaproteobacteria bacterium]
KVEFMTTRFIPALTLAAASLLSACAAQTPAAPAAKNVILFIGDGMGVSTVTAARIFDGQSRGLHGEEHVLSFEQFPNVALVKTYNTNQQTPDSAGTATAMVTGTKTRAGVINIGPEVLREDCEASLSNQLRSIGEIAKDRGTGVGFVTTTRVTHATPAVLYAHSPERDWESDSETPQAELERGCTDIASQLVSADIDVALGGSRRSFFGANNGGNRRGPDVNLAQDWLNAAPNRRYVETAEELSELKPGEQVLGLFADSHMTYVAELPADTTEPTLSAMTAAAISQLEKNENGYFLMVEAGRIDHGHHDGKPGYALIETQALNEAVETTLSMVDLDDTLILVTADHSHVFTLGGYSTRGSPILGYVVENDDRGEAKPGPDIALDGQPYTVLSYANGPGAINELPRARPDTGVHAVVQSLVPVVNYGHDGSVNGQDETHGGEDVALYAIGPGSDAVRGVMEQNLIFDIMMDALRWNEAL